MSELAPGTLCIIVKSVIPENIGRCVTVEKHIGMLQANERIVIDGIARRTRAAGDFYYVKPTSSIIYRHALGFIRESDDNGIIRREGLMPISGTELLESERQTELAQ